MCVCTCVHVFERLYVHGHVYMCLCTCVCVVWYTCVHVCGVVYMCVCVHTKREETESEMVPLQHHHGYLEQSERFMT